jgi:hypothetical protein
LSSPLGSARAVVIGATDPSETISFLSRFGFTVERVVDTETHLQCDAGVGARLIVAECGGPGTTPRDFELRARAIDLYTTDIDVALGSLDGEVRSPVGVIELGPVRMRQAMVTGPDGVPIVLVESNMRRASVLDTDPDRVFSDPHSVVWCVADRDAEAEWWVDNHHLTRGMDLAFSEPAVSEYLGLPRSPVPILMTMLSDEAVSPLRLELLSFPSDEGPAEEGGEIRGGIWALRFCDGEPTRTITSPGGIRLQV